MKNCLALLAVLVLASTAVAFHPDTECSRCHIPHMADDNSGVPLWNGDQTIDYTEFTAYYEGFRMEAVVGTSPEGSTLLCLSCHDGGAHYSMADVQGDMSGTHPIEITYDSALATADGELYNPTGTPSNVVGSDRDIAYDLLTPDGVLNCVSCHDVHIQGLHGSTALVSVTDDTTGEVTTETIEFDIPHLVNMDGIEWSYNSRSGLPRTDTDGYRFNYSVMCRTCHDK